METWGAHGTFAARYAGQWARAGAEARGRRIKCPLLLAACIVVGVLLGSLALGSGVTRNTAVWSGDGIPAPIFAVGRGEPARIPAMEQGPAPFSAGLDRPLDQQPSGEPFGDDGLTVDVRRVLEQIASEG